MNLTSILYNLVGIPATGLVRTAVKPFNAKLREREGVWEDAMESLKYLPADRPRLWVHAASMGEFEQAKPVIELAKELVPDLLAVCSFYSPSGYNTQKKYPHADALLYMPFDKRSNAAYFIDSIRPDAAVFVRYEYWRNHLELMKKRNIPSMLICATKPSSGAFDKYPAARAFLSSNLDFFDEIYTVGRRHTEYFESLDINPPVHTLSDTRLDRIADKVEQARRSPLLPQKLFDDAFTLVAGSVWPEDEDILIPAMERINRDEFVLRMIFVPHEPTESHIKQLQNRLGGSVLLSELIEQKELSGKNARLAIENKHIIVDSIGKLLKLYVHADAAYIGGAFGDGVHSVTEPAGYGVPLAAGTGTENSPDAPALENIGALRRLHDEDMAFFWLNEMIGDEEKRRTTGNKAGEYVMAARGSSEIIARKIAEKINI